MSGEKLFEFGGMWIGRVQGSQQLYRFWYDSRNGEVRRRSLKTASIEEAKSKLAEIVVSDAPVKADDPDQVPLVFVLTHYLEGHADARPSAHVSRRACDLVMQFLEKKCGFDPNVKTSQFSNIYQAEYAKWSATEFGHSPAYVSRVLSVISAACRYAAKTKLVKNTAGEMREAKLLRYVPEINYDAKWLSEVMQVAEPKPRDYIPSFEELASLLDMKGSEVLRRYDIIALNTWARPEAIMDLSVRRQVDFDTGLLNLNPPGRRQNKKQRPIIRLTSNLRGWLEEWAEDHPLSYTKKIAYGQLERVVATHLKAQFNRRTTKWMLKRSGHSAETVEAMLKASRGGDSKLLSEALTNAENMGIKRITRYTLRHFMATRVRGLTGSNVGREQRSLWLGHGKRDATSWYETHDPEFLRECAQATALIIDQLDGMTQRDLVPSSIRQMRLLTSRIEKTRSAA